MLCLTRKPTETIVINNEIVIVIRRVNGKQVAIGIEAPKECRIVRGELLMTDGKDRAA